MSLENTILKRVSIGYLCFIIVVFLFYSIFYWFEGVKTYAILAAVCVFIHAFLIFIPWNLNYDAIKALVPIYLVLISFVIYPFAILHWQAGESSAFTWFFIIPCAVMLYFSMKGVIFWFIYVFIAVASAFLVSPLISIPDEYIIVLSSKQSTIITLSTFVFSLSLIFFFLYNLNKIYTIRLERISEEEDDEDEDTVSIDLKVEDTIEKYSELYKDIEEYFENEKPYCDADFTISQLATAIDSNVNYISKAIKLNKNMNFNVFVNTYRIEMIKEMLNKDYHNKYTIRYIYTSSGFKHQSTFNKVFKQIEGITPSDYVKDHLN